jgi:CRP-like cAMP-binding protein
VNLAELGPARAERLLSGSRSIALARNETLYGLDDPATSVYFVTSGRVKIVRANANGDEAIVGIRTAGDVFGEIAWMMPRQRRTTSAVALEPSEIARLDAALFEERLREDVVLAEAFARGLTERLAAASRELTELAGKSVAGRLVDALGRLAQRHGVRDDDGSLRIGISLTHKDLADLIGTSRETVTKELSVLADVGLVRVAQRSIVLIAPQAFPFVRRAEPQSDATR